MKTYGITLVIILFLSACESDVKEITSVKTVSSLSTINTKYWDANSIKIVQDYLSATNSNITYSKKKRISEVLITHKNQQQAIEILNEIDYSKSQYLTFLMALSKYQLNQLEESLSVIEESGLTKLDSSIQNLKFKILLGTGNAKKIIHLSTLSDHVIFLTNTLTKYYLAMAYLQSNSCEKAIPLFIQVLKENPTANKVYAPLANAHQQCKEVQAAKVARKKQGTNPLSNTDEFHSRLFKNGDPVGYQNQQLNIALANNDTKNIIKISEKLIEFKASNPTILNNYAISLYQSGRLELANKALFEASQLDKKNTKTLQLLFEFNRVNNIGVAEKAIDQLIAIEPNNTLYNQAKNYLKEQKR